MVEACLEVLLLLHQWQKKSPLGRDPHKAYGRLDPTNEVADTI